MQIFRQNLFRTCLKPFLKSILLVVIFFTFILPQNSYALDGGTGVGRVRACDGNGNPSALLSGLLTVPLGDSDDLVFDLGNPICLTIALSSYLIVKAAIYEMNSVCNTGSGARITPSIFLDSIDVAKATKNIPTYGAACGIAVTSAGGAIISFMAILAGVYDKAEAVYNSAKICGHNWRKANTDQYDLSTPNHLQEVNDAVQGYIDANDTASLSFNNKVYREWYYGGVEVEDNVYGYDLDVSMISDVNTDGNYVETDEYVAKFGAATCLDPTIPNPDGSYPKQKYYMKGSQIANFNCERYAVFNSEDPKDGSPQMNDKRIADFKRAYNCCRARSANYICIDYSDTKMFCKAGSRCIFKNNDGGLVTFEATKKSSNLICAATYDLCPYNFSVSGGTQICDYFKDGIYDEDSGKWKMITTEDVESGNCSGKSIIRENDCSFNTKAGKCQNYCQQLTHCTTTNDSTYKYRSELTSPYFSSACFDFTGDSRNRTSYDSGFIMGSQRHFSAPIAQCVKETMENVFYNRFGHSKCLSSTENPSETGICVSNNYEIFNTGTKDVDYKKGGQVYDKSFFATLQSNLHTAIKLVITLAITFYGVTTLLGVGAIKKSELILFSIKMGLVLYFSTSTAWQDVFFKGVYDTSGDISQMVFKINVGDNPEKRDGCQFGDMTTSKNGTIVNSSYKPYPEGKDYLALWDTLDCKIARYMGFGPEVSAANIAMLFVAGIFTGAYGLYFAFAIMFFGFFFLVTAIRALHIFLSSATSIIMMVYVSPMVIPTAMFKKTANIFKSWATQLVGFCLQPIILFAYIAIFITIMDKVLIGSASFHGNGPNKTISCKEYCADSDGNVVPQSCATDPLLCDADCDDLGHELVDPMNNSFACLININSFGKFPGLEIIGISVPILINVFDGNVKEKVLTLVKAALVMYILCQFMDQIPEMAAYLIGGNNLAGAGAGVMGRAKGLLSKTTGAVAALRKRGARGAWKGIKSKDKEYADHINRR